MGKHPAGVEIIIKLINPMARDWAILSNRPISFLRQDLFAKLTKCKL